MAILGRIIGSLFAFPILFLLRYFGFFKGMSLNTCIECALIVTFFAFVASSIFRYMSS